MASTRPVMWPPDRGFRREPPIDSAAENISTFEKIIRYAEKDDILLYLTACFGIFMPAVMYFVYKAAHAKYESYSKKKRAEKRKEKAKQKAITILYMPGGRQFKKFAYDLAEKLEGFDPMVIALMSGNLNTFRGYKGVMIFLVPDIDPSELPEEQGTWFLDWLQEIKFETREVTLLSSLKYATVGLNLEEKEPKGKLSNLLCKRLSALSAKQLCPPQFLVNSSEVDVDDQLNDHAEVLIESIKESWQDYDSDNSELLSTDEELSDFDLEEEELLEMANQDKDKEPKKEK